MITIQELLYNHGLSKDAKVKLIRHKDSRVDLYNMFRTNKDAFLEYQYSQSKDVFNRVDYIVSFIGEDGLMSRLIGVFKILSKKQISDNRFEYEMEEV